VSDPGTHDLEDSGDEYGGESLAGEYVLGLLSGEALLDARGRMANDATFARDVADWDERLAPLFDTIAPIAPPARVWEAIAAALQHRSAEAAANGEVVHLRRQVRRWQLGTGVAAALASVLAIVGLQPARVEPGAPPPATAVPVPPPLIAAFAPKGGGTISVVYRPHEGRLIARASELPNRAGHDLELWVLPPGGAPLPLGVVPPDNDRSLALAPAIPAKLSPGAMLAVSLEPVGGSPTGLPTGPVLATAKITPI
jgi:anti-sigma-K factor RskA